MILLSALGGALTFASVIDMHVAGHYEASAEAVYGAEAAIDVALEQLAAVPDWTVVHSGLSASPLVDGAITGVRSTPAARIDLAAATAQVRAGPGGRPWHVYICGALDTVLALRGAHPDIYVIVWVAAHPVEPAGNRALLLAHAYARYGVRRVVEASAVRTSPADVRIAASRRY